MVGQAVKGRRAKAREKSAIMSGEAVMLESRVRRGKEPGVILRPHKFGNGKYKAEKFKGGDWEWVETEQGLRPFLQRGWSIRMSNPDTASHKAPSLIVPRFVRGWL